MRRSPQGSPGGSNTACLPWLRATSLLALIRVTALNFARGIAPIATATLSGREIRRRDLASSVTDHLCQRGMMPRRAVRHISSGLIGNGADLSRSLHTRGDNLGRAPTLSCEGKTHQSKGDRTLICLRIRFLRAPSLSTRGVKKYRRRYFSRSVFARARG